MFEKIARFSVKFRWFIVVFWIAMIPLATAVFPDINSVTKNNNSDFLPKGTPTEVATELESKFQDKDTAGSVNVVAARDSGPLTDADKSALERLQDNYEKNKNVTEVKDLGVSADGRAQQLSVGLGGAAFGEAGLKLPEELRAEFKKVGAPAGLQLHLAGEFAAAVDAENANTEGRANTELYTVIFIIVLLLFVFRAVLAPIITIIPAGIALAIAQPLIAQSTEWGVQVGFITQILLIVLILGAGADYGLFLIFRVREELRKGLAPKEAVVQALAKVGESITFSAATVICALLSLVIASFGIYSGLGPALAIGLAVMLLISLTFLPALLAILGRAVFWPSKTKAQELKIGLWGKIADKVIEKPMLMLVLGVLIFGGLSLGAIGYKASGFGSQAAPEGSDSAQGQSIIEKHFPTPEGTPQLLIYKFDKPVWDNLEVVQQAQQKLEASGKFSTVSGPFNANGFNLTPEMLEKLHDTDPDNQIFKAVGQFISADGSTFQFFGMLKDLESGTSKAASAIPEIQAAVDQVGKDIGASQSGLLSNDSASHDVNEIANSDLKKIIPVVLLIIALLLAVMLRSLVAPLYLILTVALSYFASLGFAMLVFVHLGGQDGLFFVLPFMMFIFCMALGEDYNILVMSRIREEAHGKVTMKQAVAKAIGVTGTTVTSAGLILAGSFAVLGLVGGDPSVGQIGYGIAFGILLDTFFVRTLLVPSIVVLLGKWNWWPSKLHKQH